MIASVSNAVALLQSTLVFSVPVFCLFVIQAHIFNDPSLPESCKV